MYLVFLFLSPFIAVGLLPVCIGMNIDSAIRNKAMQRSVMPMDDGMTNVTHDDASFIKVETTVNIVSKPPAKAKSVVAGIFGGMLAIVISPLSLVAMLVIVTAVVIYTLCKCSKNK